MTKVESVERASENCLSYDEVRDRCGDETRALLLGNGFSIGYSKSFSYESLYDKAKDSGLSAGIQRIFERLGTNNFEGVLRLLDDSRWIAEVYGLSRAQSLIDDAEALKRALVDAIANIHPDAPADITPGQRQGVEQFLSDYDSIFTTNYDLLLYWVKQDIEPPFVDGFGDAPTGSSLVFQGEMQSSRAIHFLHGALHLYMDGADLRKHSSKRRGRKLTELIGEGLRQGRYPLFVAEGLAEKKRQQIGSNPYLSHCYDKLSRIECSLVCFGLAFGDSDQHIMDALVHNQRLRTLYVGLYSAFDSEEGHQVRGRIEGLRQARVDLYPSCPVEVHFYDSNSAPVWRSAPPTSG